MHSPCFSEARQRRFELTLASSVMHVTRDSEGSFQALFNVSRRDLELNRRTLCEQHR